MPIKKVLKSAGSLVKIWTSEIESDAMDQLKNIASLPFVYRHVAVMPDVHLGKGATVGSVIATRDAVIPAAVGVDIGCGMMAVRTDIRPAEIEGRLPEIRSFIEKAVPVGHLGNKTILGSVESWNGWTRFGSLAQGASDNELFMRAKSQLGSLGGGNHFIEICLDRNDRVWIMLHSGSRNVGKVLAERHINEAKGLMKKMFISLPDPDLSYLVRGTREFDSYIRDLMWAQDYALANRNEMMRRITEVVAKCLGRDGRIVKDMEVSCHHNYVAIENHYGENVYVTRKGAVRARLGDLGIIPGSMGNRSFIVRGLGNEESFCSCSHGAGRRMSRSKAKKTFTVEDLARQTEGIECRKDEGVVDEIPGAYKDIDKVMGDQSDLVEVVAELRQILCIKG